MNAPSTFAQPDAAKRDPYGVLILAGGELHLELPARTVVVVETG